MMRNKWMSVGLTFVVVLSGMAVQSQAQYQPVRAQRSLPTWTPPPGHEQRVARPAQAAWHSFESEAHQQFPPAFEIGRQRASQSQKLMMLSARIRGEKDEEKRELHAKELAAEMERLFDADLENREAELEKLESRLAKLRKSVEKRETSRDRIIKNRIESLMLEADGLGLPGEAADGFGYDRRVREMPPTYPTANSPDFTNPIQPQWKVLETYPDGSRKVMVPVMKSTLMTQTRMVPSTKTQVHTRNRMDGGKRQVDQEPIPETANRQENYQVTVPMQTATQVIVKKGQSIEDAVREFRKAEEGTQLELLFDNPESVKNNQLNDVFGSDEDELSEG